MRRERSPAEAHLYMDLQPCVGCGRLGFDGNDSAVIMSGRELAARYRAVCPQCGTRREFVFLLPEETMPIFHDALEPRYGDDSASELLDAAEWLWLSDLASTDVPTWPRDLPAETCHDHLCGLREAAACVAEVLKFVPPGSAHVPPEAVWTERGRELYERSPGRFRRDRLEVLRATYREMSDRFESRAR
jgi:hypothetical protein